MARKSGMRRIMRFFQAAAPIVGILLIAGASAFAQQNVEEIEDFSNIDIIYIPFIWKLKNISWSFVQFRYLLDYLDDDKLTNIEKKISEIRKHWEVMINSIAMSIIRHDSSVSIENIQDYIRKAVYSEKLLIQELSLYR